MKGQALVSESFKESLKPQGARLYPPPTPPHLSLDWWSTIIAQDRAEKVQKVTSNWIRPCSVVSIAAFYFWGNFQQFLKDRALNSCFHLIRVWFGFCENEGFVSGMIAVMRYCQSISLTSSLHEVQTVVFKAHTQPWRWGGSVGGWVGCPRCSASGAPLATDPTLTLPLVTDDLVFTRERLLPKNAHWWRFSRWETVSAGDVYTKCHFKFGRFCPFHRQTWFIMWPKSYPYRFLTGVTLKLLIYFMFSWSGWIGLTVLVRYWFAANYSSMYRVTHYVNNVKFSFYQYWILYKCCINCIKWTKGMALKKCRDWSE